MAAYFLRRFLLMIPTLLGITMLVFALTRILPGGPMDLATQGQQMGGEVGGGSTNEAGQGLTKKQKQAMAEQFGFDKPWYIAYPVWLGKTLTFDFGESFQTSEPVITKIAKRLPISITFGLTGFLIAYLVSVPLGIAKALRHGHPFDFGTSFLVFLGYSIPGWALGMVMLTFFAEGTFHDFVPGTAPETFKVFPLGDLKTESYSQLPDFIKEAEPLDKVSDRDGRFVWEKMSVSSKLLDSLWHMALPVFCYMLGSFATLTILTKNSLMENLSQDYVRTALAKGVSPRRVIFLHALRNSLIPLATGLGHALSIVMAGSYLIEYVFNIQGIGLLGFNSLVGRDYPVVMAILVINSTLILLGNIFADILYALIDPRIRFE